MNKPLLYRLSIAGLLACSLNSYAEQGQDNDADNDNNDYSFREYRANYIVFSNDGGGDGNGNPNSACDAKFQFSFIKPLKTDVINDFASDKLGFQAFNILGRLNFSYTQKSFWDLCRSSYPFRESNYNPALFWQNDFSIKGFENIRFENGYGYEHESNGRDGEVSRSWDRLFYEQNFGIGRLNPSDRFNSSHKAHYDYEAGFKLWAIVADGDENKDINKFLGYGEIYLAKTTLNNRFKLTARKRSGRLDWYIYNIFGSPKSGGDFYWMLQYFTGYGDSLESYNRRQSVFRLGFALTY